MPPESAFNMVSEAVPTPMRPSHATPLDCTAPILAAALSRSCIGSAGLLGWTGDKKCGGAPGGVPVTTITIDLTAHPRRFHTVPSPAVAFLHLRASGSLRTASPKCAVDRIAVCSPIIDNGVCNIASVAVPASLPPPYRLHHASLPGVPPSAA